MSSILHTISVIPESFLEFRKVPVLMSLRDGAHTLDFPELRVLDRELDRKESIDILRLTPPINTRPRIGNGRRDVPDST